MSSTIYSVVGNRKTCYFSKFNFYGIFQTQNTKNTIMNPIYPSPSFNNYQLMANIVLPISPHFPPHVLF